jgi:hypothetical protein
MNREDLRDCFAMFKALTGASPKECYEFADEMLEVREIKAEEDGIVAIKPKRRYARKN